MKKLKKNILNFTELSLLGNILLKNPKAKTQTQDFDVFKMSMQNSKSARKYTYFFPQDMKLELFHKIIPVTLGKKKKTMIKYSKTEILSEHHNI